MSLPRTDIGFDPRRGRTIGADPRTPIAATTGALITVPRRACARA